MTKDRIIGRLECVIDNYEKDGDNILRDLTIETLKESVKYLKESNKHIGYWVAEENEEMEIVGYFCSECDCPMETEEKSNFCPNCGADMREA